MITLFVHSINLDAIASLEARRQQIEAKYHDIYQPDDDRSGCRWYCKRIWVQMILKKNSTKLM